MSLSRHHALALCVAAAAALTFNFAGCSSTPPSYEAAHPDASLYSKDDSGLQSKDLIDMTDKMAPDVLKIPEIAQSPTKAVIVMTNIENHTNDPSADMRIYLARIRSMLNTHARDRLAFVENRTTTERLQAAEGATPPSDPFEEGTRGNMTAPPPSRLIPQYALKGEFYEKRNNTTSYYLCTFQLTNIKTGEQLWENSYEIKTLNWQR